MFRRRTGSPDDPEGAGGLLITPTKSPADGFSRRQRQRSSRLSTIACLGLLLLAVWAFASGHLMFSRTPARALAGGSGELARYADKRRLPDGSWAPTLCIYVFSNTDPEYLENLRFFVKFGMAPDDGVTYLVVVQEQEGQPVGGRVMAGWGGMPYASACLLPVPALALAWPPRHSFCLQAAQGGAASVCLMPAVLGMPPACLPPSFPMPQRPDLPTLPPNARYLYHKNECYDWGTIGWVFSSGQVGSGAAHIDPCPFLRPDPLREAPGRQAKLLPQGFRCSNTALRCVQYLRASLLVRCPCPSNCMRPLTPAAAPPHHLLSWPSSCLCTLSTCPLPCLAAGQPRGLQILPVYELVCAGAVCAAVCAGGWTLMRRQAPAYRAGGHAPRRWG